MDDRVTVAAECAGVISGSEAVVGSAVIRLSLWAAWTMLVRSPVRRVFPGVQVRFSI
jgi:hypothetical protein